MAGNITEQVRNLIDSNPIVHDAVALGIVNYSNLAKVLKSEVESRIGESVGEQAIVMAARRHAKELRVHNRRGKGIEYELQMTTGIFDVNLVRSSTFISKLPEIYALVDQEKGEFLNITLGSHEISFTVSQKHKGSVLGILEGENIIRQWDDLVSLSVLFQGEFIDTPGLIYEATRSLFLEKVNLVEIVSTYNVLSFVISREDSMRAYKVLESFLKNY